MTIIEEKARRWIPPYRRADGTHVTGYWREVVGAGSELPKEWLEWAQRRGPYEEFPDPLYATRWGMEGSIFPKAVRMSPRAVSYFEGRGIRRDALEKAVDLIKAHSDDSEGVRERMIEHVRDQTDVGKAIEEIARAEDELYSHFGSRTLYRAGVTDEGIESWTTASEGATPSFFTDPNVRWSPTRSTTLAQAHERGYLVLAGGALMDPGYIGESEVVLINPHAIKQGLLLPHLPQYHRPSKDEEYQATREAYAKLSPDERLELLDPPGREGRDYWLTREEADAHLDRVGDIAAKSSMPMDVVGYADSDIPEDLKPGEEAVLGRPGRYGIDKEPGEMPPRIVIPAGSPVIWYDWWWVIPEGTRIRMVSPFRYEVVPAEREGKKGRVWVKPYVREGGHVEGYWRNVLAGAVEGAEPWKVSKEQWVPSYDAELAKLNEAGKTDEAMALYAERRAREKQWEQSVRRAISLGFLKPEDAVELGYRLDSRERRHEYVKDRGGWQPLPDELYHATLSVPSVMREGLKTRSDREGVGGGLGGGSDEDISLTANPAYAEAIAGTLRDIHDLMVEDLTIQDLIDQATKGEGADKPWIRDLMRQMQTFDRTWEKGDPLPAEAERLVSRTATFTDVFNPMTPEQANSAEGRALLQKWNPGRKPIEGKLSPVGEKDDQGRYRGWARPLTDEEYRWDAYQFYSAWAAWRAQAGGQDYTAPFGPNLDLIASTPKEDIGVVRVQPIKGAMGYYLGDHEWEWRTATGDAVTVTDVVKPGERGGKKGRVWVKPYHREGVSVGGHWRHLSAESSAVPLEKPDLLRALSDLPPAKPGTVRVYHGTTEAGLTRAREHGAIQSMDVETLAHDLEDEFGLERDSVWQHPYNEFARWRKPGEVFVTDNPETAIYYAEVGNEPVDDALKTAYVVLHPEMRDMDVNSEEYAAAKRDMEHFKSRWREEHGWNPVVVALDLPEKDIPVPEHSKIRDPREWWDTLSEGGRLVGDVMLTKPLPLAHEVATFRFRPGSKGEKRVWVKPYHRADGSSVSGFWRNVDLPGGDEPDFENGAKEMARILAPNTAKESINVYWDPKGYEWTDGGVWKLKPADQLRKFRPDEPHVAADDWSHHALLPKGYDLPKASTALIHTSPPNPPVDGLQKAIRLWLRGFGRETMRSVPWPWWREIRADYAKLEGHSVPDLPSTRYHDIPPDKEMVANAARALRDGIAQAPPAQPSLWRGLESDEWSKTISASKPGDTLKMLPASYSRDVYRAMQYTDFRRRGVMLYVVPGSRGVADKQRTLHDEEVITAGDFEVLRREEVTVPTIRNKEKRKFLVVTVRQRPAEKKSVKARVWVEPYVRESGHVTGYWRDDLSAFDSGISAESLDIPSETHEKRIWVRPYARADGGRVAGYWRQGDIAQVPMLHSIRDSLELPKSGELRKQSEHALDAIDKVIQVPDMPRIPVRATAGKNARGGYLRRNVGDVEVEEWKGPTVRLRGFGRGASQRPAVRADEIMAGDIRVFNYNFQRLVIKTEAQPDGKVVLHVVSDFDPKTTEFDPESGVQTTVHNPDELIPIHWEPEVTGKPKFVPNQIRVSARGVTDGEAATDYFPGLWNPDFTLVHEIGHFIDNAALGRSESGAETGSLHASYTVRDPEMRKAMIEEASDGSLLKDILKGWEGTTSPLEEWLGAVENTDAYEKLGSATMMEHGTHAYLRKPSELFARSFAQWIALRSGDERLKQNVDNWLNVPSMYTRDVENWNGVKVPVEAITPNHIKYRQWQWDDFEPVAKALDKLFGDLGWLRQEQRRAA